MLTDYNNVRNWASILDEGTRLQAEMLARSSVVSGPVALMPDAHVGMGATVGSVIVTENAIIPAACGVDLGCGMIACKTNLRDVDLPDNLQPLIDDFSRDIPSGVGKAHKDIDDSAGTWMSKNPLFFESGKLAFTAATQLGTLGSGNHFLEVCLDEFGIVWVVIHSGSRGVGNQLASKHIKLAKQQEQSLEDRDLAYFLNGTDEFREYIVDMLWSQKYALQNREMMMNKALKLLFGFVLEGFGPYIQPREFSRINCHHNFAQEEVHGGITLWVTRKGAIKATRSDYGVIPGSMGDRSYIVRGKGNPLSYNSCAHGAGRVMSRSKAKKELTTESLDEKMKGIAWNQNHQALLDEHPDAYKNIDQVMEDQRDLVEVVSVLKQVANYKGV